MADSLSTYSNEAPPSFGARCRWLRWTGEDTNRHWFAWMGAFPPAPNTRPPAQLVLDPDAAKLKLLWLFCGNKAGLPPISQGMHACLKEEDVPLARNVDGHAHHPTEWRNNFYSFLQRVLR
jgi:hypothetical protein